MPEDPESDPPMVEPGILNTPDVESLRQRLIDIDAQLISLVIDTRQLTTQVNQQQITIQRLFARPTHSSTLVSEPQIPNPEPFKGDRLQLPIFLSRCRLKFLGEPSKFRNELHKIFYAASYMEGDPFSWYMPLFAEFENGISPPEFKSFQSFADALTTIFGDPNLERIAERELSQLRQTSSVAQYISEFIRIRQYLKYNDSALTDRCYEGLNDDVKECISYDERPKTLTETIGAANLYDSQIQERLLERIVFAPQVTSRTPSSPSLNVPTQVPSPGVSATPQTAPVPKFLRLGEPNTDGATPIQIRSSSQITPQERERRRQNGLCFYCASPEHGRATCPIKPNPKTTPAPLFVPLGAPNTDVTTPMQIYSSVGPLADDVKEHRPQNELCMYCASPEHRGANCPVASNMACPPPMQFDSRRGGIAPTERERRKLYNLCLYCGATEHNIAKCPLRPTT